MSTFASHMIYMFTFSLASSSFSCSSSGTRAFTFNKKFMNIVFKGRRMSLLRFLLMSKEICVIKLLTVYTSLPAEKLNGMRKLPTTYFFLLSNFIMNLWLCFDFDLNTMRWKEIKYCLMHARGRGGSESKINFML